VKLAFYVAKRGNLHSLFVVREVTDTETRQLKQWWFIPFDRLASYASWSQQGGGTNMLGGSSSVVRIPKDRFTKLTKDELDRLQGLAVPRRATQMRWRSAGENCTGSPPARG
jgi:hypothetical protein